MKLSVSTTINSSKEKVWAAITDIENCQDMISGIIGVSILNKPDDGLVGLKWKETRLMFGKEADETMWITHAEDESYYLTRAENHGAIYISKMTIAQDNDATQLTMSFAGKPQTFIAKVMTVIMSPFMKGSMRKLLQKDLEDIKIFVESK